MNLIPTNLRWQSQLQNIIDQAPRSHSARMARELMEKIKPAHEACDEPFQPDDYAIQPQFEIGKGEI